MTPVSTLSEFREKQAKKMRADEREFIGKAIIRAKGNVAQAARDLDVTAQALWLRMKLLSMHGWLSKVRATYGDK